MKNLSYRSRRRPIASNLRWLTYVFSYELFVLGLMCVSMFFQNVGAEKAFAQTPLISPLPISSGVFQEPEQATGSVREQSIAVIKKVWRADFEIGVALASCESGLRPTAVNEHNTNGSTDSGLFQINSVHNIQREDLMNPYANAGYAYAIYKEQGTGPWYSSAHCWRERLGE